MKIHAQQQIPLYNPPKLMKHTTPVIHKSRCMKAIGRYVVPVMLALVTLGVLNSCKNEKTEKDSQGIEYVVSEYDINKRAEYIDSIANPPHTVQSGESPYSIANKYNVPLSKLQKENNLTGGLIYPNQVLNIPKSIKIKNVKSLKDASNATGLSVEYLQELEKIENPNYIRTIFLDKNNNKTIGIGHKLSADEVKLYENREITDEEKYTLLVKDLLVREDNIEGIINPSVYYSLPEKLREAVFDFVFHRGETAFENNKDLIDGINNADYVKAASNLYMNYTVVKNKKGEKVELHLAGLCKRSLYRMSLASQIFKNGIPDEVLKSAQKTYEEGLTLLKKEFDNNSYPQGTYENVKTEYMQYAHDLFDGKLGQDFGLKSNDTDKSVKTTPLQPSSEPAIIQQPAITTHTPVYVQGKKISRTKEQIELDWANTANRYARPFKRPALELDANGNVTAHLEVIHSSNKNGILSGKVIIVNQGHGGCAAYAGSPENTAFDPGASNAIMEPILGSNGKFKRSSSGELILKESNKFVGNGGKALEEWKVNENFAKDLIKKLTDNGADVVFISGEVHNAQNAIRKYEREHKVNLFISLHSNSSESIKTAVKNGKEYVSERITPRGFFIIPNNRGGDDVKDFALAKKINENFHKDNWLVGLGDVRGRSLGVLSSDRHTTSPVPGVLIETGNLKNPTDVANLNSRDFRERLLNATFNGIVEYLKPKQ